MRVLLVCAFVMCGSAGFAVAGIQYTLVDLGAYTGDSSHNPSVNALGRVAFSTGTPSHAFLTGAIGVGLSDLGTLGNDPSLAAGVNAGGQVAGTSNTLDNGVLHAFLSDPDGGTLNDIGTLGGTYSDGLALNDAGQVTGNSTTTDDTAIHGFLYTSGTMVDIGTLAGGFSSYGLGINSQGQVTGYADVTGGANHAILYDPTGTGTLTDLGTLSGGTYSQGYAINNNGEVVGVADNASGDSHAFVTGSSGTNMFDIGTLGGSSSLAYFTNNKGVVVGQSGTTGDLTTHAFLYQNSTMIDLNSLVDPSTGFELNRATSVSESGYIVGVGTRNGVTEAFLLIPVPPTEAAPVPEPSTHLLVISALVLTSACRWMPKNQA